jgi:eukaryotic translation initiation factor 2C
VTILKIMSGADVGHPGAGMKNQPSVASLVWSFDMHAMKYVAFSSVQEPRQESIEALGPMIMVYQFVSVGMLDVI